MVSYVDPEGEDTSRVRRGATPAERARRIQRRRELNAQLPEDQAVARAREAALTLLDHQARSSGEIAQKLSDKGYQEPVVSTVVHRLEDLGLLNDREYAFMLARTRFSERGLVGQALRGELRKKGMPNDLIAEACDAVEADGQRERALQLAQKKMRSCRSLPRERAFARCASYLARRGYPPSLSYEVIREAWEDQED